MKSFNGDATLKADILAEMKKHLKQDDFIKGEYAKNIGRFKGCAVGCSVQSLNVRNGLKLSHDDHAALAEALNIPEWLWHLQDKLFENLKHLNGSNFAVNFIEALPVGIDLEPVRWRFFAFLLKENIDRVILLRINAKLKEEIVSAIKGCLELHENEVVLSSPKWASALSAARSAARSAERAAEFAAYAAALATASAITSLSEFALLSAAQSAALAAAASAAADVPPSAAWATTRTAESAADSAAYIRYAKELLRLLRKQGFRKKRYAQPG